MPDETNWKPNAECAEQRDDLAKALRELVSCKDLKEQILESNDSPGSPELSVMFSDYKHRQPLAWAAARAALAKVKSS